MPLFYRGIAGKRGANPRGAILHNDAGGQYATKAHYQQWLPNHDAYNGFAHRYTASDGTYDAESYDNMAYHAGNAYYNQWFIGYEACQSMGDKETFLINEKTCLKEIAQMFKKYGITPNRTTVILHQEASPTACPHRSFDLHGRSVNAVKDYFIAEIKRYMDGGTGKPTPLPPVVVAGAQFQEGAKLQIASHATYYQTGQKINQSVVKGKTYTVAKNGVKDLGKTQSNSRYAYLLMSGNTAIGWVLQQDIVGGKKVEAPKPIVPPKNKIPSGFEAQNGTFTNGDTPVQVRVGKAGLNATRGGMLPAWEVIKYDSVAIVDGFTWIHYIGYGNVDLYCPVRQWYSDGSSNPFGTFK